MADFKRIGTVLGESAHPVAAPPVRYVVDNPEREAQAERDLIARAGQPEVRDGKVVSSCGVCHGMGWLRVDVPVNHKLFGHRRLCPCNRQYAIYGDKWYPPHGE